jgi:hypothetical protein
VVRKSYEALKRQIKKKTGITNGVKALLQPLSTQLIEEEVLLKQSIMAVSEKRKLITAAQEEVTCHMLQFMQIDGLEKDKKLVLYLNILFLSCNFLRLCFTYFPAVALDIVFILSIPHHTTPHHI